MKINKKKDPELIENSMKKVSNSQTIEAVVEKNIKSRKFKDILPNGATYFFSFLCLIVLCLVIGFVFFEGSSYLSWDFITSNYSRSSITLKSEDNSTFEGNYDYSDLERFKNITYSEKWGIGLELGKDNNQNDVIYVVQISENSPFNTLIRADDQTHFVITSEFYISYITVKTSDGMYLTANGNRGIENMVETLNQGDFIYDSQFLTKGGGIRSSIISTCLLILFTLIFSLPLGIGGAIYLAYYAKDNKVTRIIRSLVDMSSGIPSIIFGLVGAAIFIPIIGSISGSNGGNVFTGALTLTLILLPTIVKTVEESIKTIPKSMISASLALGASHSETIFKIILPNSIEGILNATILSIGRTIGESAALVFAMGTLIAATPSLTSANTTLAVHIWYILAGETPQYGQACAISIIILIVVLLLSLSSKLISYLFKKKKER